MLTIKNNMVTVLDAVYILSNNDGYMDGDKQCLVIKNVL